MYHENEDDGLINNALESLYVKDDTVIKIKASQNSQNLTRSVIATAYFVNHFFKSH